jgi:hypothetical protein
LQEKRKAISRCSGDFPSGGGVQLEKQHAVPQHGSCLQNNINMLILDFGIPKIACGA